MQIKNKLLVLLLATVLFGCVDNPKEVKTTIINKIYRENLDGTSTVWTTSESIKFNNGFVGWDTEDGEIIYIAGNVTVISNKIVIDIPLTTD